MAHPSTHLAAILILLVGTQDGVHSHYQQASRGGHGRNRFNAWPSAFMSNDLDGGAFRPFHAYPRGGGVFNSGGPLVDVFQEVIGDIKKAARELSDHAGTSTRTPPHDIIGMPDYVTVSVDLPGCKKQDVDAQISEESGTQTLKITATRKKVIHPHGPEATTAQPGSQQAQDTANGRQSPSNGSPDASAESSAVSPASSYTEEKFELSFRIGDGIDVSAVRATLEDGVLLMVLPRVAPEPPAQPIDIPIDPPSAAGSKGRGGVEHHGESPKGGEVGSGGTDNHASSNTHISLS